MNRRKTALLETIQTRRENFMPGLFFAELFFRIHYFRKIFLTDFRNEQLKTPLDIYFASTFLFFSSISLSNSKKLVC